MEDNTGQNYPSLAMLLLFTKERPETTSLQGQKEGTWGAKDLKKNLLDIKTVLVSKGTETVVF